MTSDLGLFKRQRYNPPSISGFGGNVTLGCYSTSTVYAVHVFTSSGAFTLPAYLTTATARVFLVGGGGGGGASNGNSQGGGGGAGGVLSSSTYLLSPGTTYAVAVGSGGTYGVNGNVSKVGGPADITYSGYFGGSSYLQLGTAASTAVNALAKNSFVTIEFWVNTQVIQAITAYSSAIFGQFPSAAQNSRFQINLIGSSTVSAQTVAVYWTTGTGSSDSVTTTGTINQRTWNHIAITLDMRTPASTTIKIFINGVAETFTGKNLSTHSADNGNPTYLGGSYGTGDQSMTGYLSNFRFTKNALVYTSNFVPPIGQLTSSTTDPLYGISFNGSNYLSIPTNALLNLSTGDFTVEAWIYPTQIAADWFVISSSGSGGLFFGNKAVGGFGYGRTAVAWDYNAGTIVINTWQHIALTRSGTSIRVFINGVQQGVTQTSAQAYDLGVTSTTVGSQGAGNYFSGYISNLRVVKGTAVYTSTFIPPYSVLTTTQSSGTNIDAISTASYVSLLTAQSATIVDNSTYAQTITAVGTPTVISTVTLTPTALLTLQDATFIDKSGNNYTLTASATPPTTSSSITPPIGLMAFGGGAGSPGASGGANYGYAGASGGGSGVWNYSGTIPGGQVGYYGQGTVGGGSTGAGSNFASGGGGGAWKPGGSASAVTSIGGAGGTGTVTTFISTGVAITANIGQYITATNAVYFAGGGGGGGNGSFNVGGWGGGGTDGWSLSPGVGQFASGGGGGGSGGNGATGGSGVVVITYPLPKGFSPVDTTPTDAYFKNTSLLLTGAMLTSSTPTQWPVDYLVVGGGGGGGGSNSLNNDSGGGGGGGVATSSTYWPTSTIQFAISVGAGGASPGYVSALGQYGSNGGNSSAVVNNLTTATTTATYAALFNGTTDYFSTSTNNFDPGTGDFTIEGWVYNNGYAGSQYGRGLFSLFQSASYANRLLIRLDSGSNAFNLYLNVGAGVKFGSSGTTTPGIAPVGRWAHFALVRNSGTFNFFVNGQLNNSITGVSDSFAGFNTIEVGRSQDGTVPYWNGYLSNIRYVVGTALYKTSYFIPSYYPLTAVSGTQLLTLQNATFKDNSANNLTITPVGTPTITSASAYTPPLGTIVGLGGGGGGSNGVSGQDGGSGGGGGMYPTNTPGSSQPGGAGIQPTSFWTGYGNGGGAGFNYNWACTGGGGGAGGGANGADPGIGISLANFSAYGEGGYFASGGSGVRGGNCARSMYKQGGGGGFLSNAQWMGSATVPRAAITATGGGGALGFPGASGTVIIRHPINYGSATVTGNPATTSTGGYTYYQWSTSGTIQFNPQLYIQNTNTSFVDSSANALTITPTSTPTQGTFTPFGNNWSNYFGASTDYLSLPVNAANSGFSTGNFTVEAWIYPTVAQATTIASSNYSYGTAAGNWAFYTTVGSANTLYFNGGSASTSGANHGSSVTTTIPLNQWTHVAYSKISSVGYFFINGVQLGTGVADTTGYSGATGTLYIGRQADGTGYLTGYISNLRILNGTALYTGNFTPSITPLGLPTNTALLTATSNRYTDKSGVNSAITAGGSPQVTRFSPFTQGYAYNSIIHSGSTYFNGSSVITAPSTSAFSFGASANFTVEAWVYWPASVSSNQTYIEFNGTTRLIIGRTSSGFRLYNNGTEKGFTYTFNTGSWYHIAVVRNTGLISVYINGVLANTAYADTTTWAHTVANVGRNYDAAEAMTGYVANLRVVKDVAVYVTNFTPLDTPMSSVQTSFIPSGVVMPTAVTAYAWGGGGGGGQAGGWNFGAAAGAGGAAEGTIAVTKNATYYVTVGGAGQVSPSSGVYAVGGGGTPSNNTDNRYGGGGGGYSAIFNNVTASQGAAILMAGGGGGGGSSRTGTGNVGGAGGGAVAQAGSSVYDGNSAYAGGPGTQTGSSAGTGGNAGTALQGASPGTNSYGGSGGGGYWGGGTGGYAETNSMPGGGGGSGYINTSTVTAGILTVGSGTTPGNNNSPFRGTAGVGGAVASAGTGGIVVVRYPDSYSPIVTTGSPTLQVSGGYRTYTWTASGSFTISGSTPDTIAIQSAQTNLLLNGNNSGIIDATMQNDVIVSGAAALTKDVVKFNARSIYINGTSNYISGSSNPAFSFSGDFTVEMWLYMISQTSSAELFIAGNFHLNFRNTAGQIAITNDATVLSNLSNTIPTGQWTHIAAVRSSGNMTIYLNGVPNTVATGQTYSFTQSGWSIGTGGSGFVGYIDDVRITNGVARYTANFTPPIMAPKLK